MTRVNQSDGFASINRVLIGVLLSPRGGTGECIGLVINVLQRTQTTINQKRGNNEDPEEMSVTVLSLSAKWMKNRNKRAAGTWLPLGHRLIIRTLFPRSRCGKLGHLHAHDGRPQPRRQSSNDRELKTKLTRTWCDVCLLHGAPLECRSLHVRRGHVHGGRMAHDDPPPPHTAHAATHQPNVGEFRNHDQLVDK